MKRGMREGREGGRKEGKEGEAREEMEKWEGNAEKGKEKF